jgi:hypothetical protein
MQENILKARALHLNIFNDTFLVKDPPPFFFVLALTDYKVVSAISIEFTQDD